GLTALLVSLFTLVVFIYQTNLIRQQQYMSVYPYLSMGNEYSSTLKYGYSLRNEGIGPAIIESVKVSYAKSKVYDDLVNYVEAMLNRASILYNYASLTEERLITANGKIPLIQLVDKDMYSDYTVDGPGNLPINTLEDSNMLFKILNDKDLHIEIIYSSVYGEKWRLRNHTYAPVKLD
ncbi:MAG: hypothetical protein AB3N16_05225, partial [Flavobacteriaceae bacterium]